MDITQLKDKLDEAQFNQLSDYIKHLIGQKEEARQESISQRKGLKAEVEQLRTLKATLYDKLGIDDDTDITTLEVPTKEAGVEATKQFERRYKKLEQELAAEKEQRTSLESKYRGSMLEAQLTKAISEHDFIDRDLVADYIKARTKFEDDNFIFSEGDASLSLEEGVKLIANKKPHLLKSQGSGGSGFNPNTSNGSTKPFKQMSLTERSELFKKNKALYEQLKAAA